MTGRTALNEFFNDTHQNLEGIVAAGWRIRHSTYSWVFEHAETGERVSVPHWVHELMSQAQKRGMESMQWQIKEAIMGEPRFLGACGPSLPNS